MVGNLAQRRRRAGITLVETLAVVAIIAVLLGLTFVMFSSAERSVRHLVAKAETGKKKSVVRTTANAGWALNEHLVMFKPGTPNLKAEAERLAKLTEGKILHEYWGPFGGVALKIAPGKLAALMADPVVARVEKNYYGEWSFQTSPTGVRRMSTPLPSLPGSSGLNTAIRNVRQPVISNPGGAYAAVAVVDSGVDATHPDLNVVLNVGFNATNSVFGDPHGHGTHIAGIIGARHNDMGVVGVAPGAPIWNVRVGDAQGNAPSAAFLIAALQFLAANADKVAVANLSLQVGPTSLLVNLAVADCVNKGLVITAAAGNSSIDASLASPQSAPAAITVAALADSDGLPGAQGKVTSAGNDDTFATFSNFGTIVDVIAPGVDIFSTTPLNNNQLVPGNTSGYGTTSGTSMAAPHVAGLVLLMRSPQVQAIRNVRFKGALPQAQPVLSPAAVLQRLLNSSTETIPGRFDARMYPLVSGRGL